MRLLSKGTNLCSLPHMFILVVKSWTILFIFSNSIYLETRKLITSLNALNLILENPFHPTLKSRNETFVFWQVALSVAHIVNLSNMNSIQNQL